ncbi:MAG TPA: roadblock/LC7 domain-containing protein [Gemmatimonadaceae bacterium]|nr:roadblock/LC7 domain-containing protein [Gemmatimonadaceae bacterium]
MPRLRHHLQGSAFLPGIRDLVAAVRQREGVEAAVVLGTDGLLIHGSGQPGFDLDTLAATVPSIVSMVADLARSARVGEVDSAVVQTSDGFLVITVISHEALLLVVLRFDANIAQLLGELRRNRESIATLV